MVFSIKKKKGISPWKEIKYILQKEQLEGTLKFSFKKEIV